MSPPTPGALASGLLASCEGDALCALRILHTASDVLARVVEGPAVDDLDGDELLVSEVRIVRTSVEGDDLVRVTATDNAGEQLALVEALGLLRFAEDTVIRERMEARDDAD